MNLYTFNRPFVLVAAAAALLAAKPAAAQDDDKKPSKSLTERLTDAAKKAADKKVSEKDSSTKDSDSATSLADEVKNADSKIESKKSEDKTLVMPVSGMLQERAEEMVFFGDQPRSLKDYVDMLRRAKNDKNIKRVVIRFGPTEMGMAMVQELSQAIKELQKEKKEVVAILEDDGQASYLASLACDQVIIPPSADLLLHGVNADGYFLKNLLEKVGVSVQIIHIGQYKSYGETFTHDDFTSPARQNMEEIVGDMYAQIVDTLAAGRNIDKAQAEALLNKGPVDAESAKAANMVDRVAYADEVLQEYEKDGGKLLLAKDYKSDSKKSEDVSLFSLLSMMSKKSDSSSDDKESGSSFPKVAVLYAVGPITLGSSDTSGFGSSTEIASEDIIEQLEELKEEDDIKAVIIRVNSPGGSAFASDLIWRKIEELKEKKPVVASMSDVAASGGYYISMGANKIVAQSGTITGSIGVVGGKPNLKGLYDKIGVTKTSVSKGTFTGLFSETSDFSPVEKTAIETMMKRTYDDFVGKAAKGRGKQFEQIHEVAQGRVWTGQRAKDVGLVDELGGLSTAITVTKGLINLKPDDKVRLVTYPKEKTLFDVLQKAFGTSSAQASFAMPNGVDVLMSTLPIPNSLKAVLRQATTLGQVWQKEKVLAVMPMLMQIR